ncbi:MAG TPA: trigger factor [Sedimenticola sp.]|nr:trigger factor [Sedimenticola sp.]
MQVSVEAKEGFERCMTVEVPAERVNEEVEKRLKKIARTARMDGFRPGKVPLSVIRRRFDGQVRGEVFNEILQSSYFEALRQENLQPVGDPRIEPMDKAPEEGIGYRATFEVMPEITLKEMGDAVIKRPVVEITESDIDEMIDKLRAQRQTWSEVERAAEDGDQVRINFKGYIDDEPFEGGSAEDVPLVLGSGRMIEGFEEGLAGAKANENRTLNLKFPDDYQAAHLAGKAARFEVEITQVSKPELPEVDEEFIKMFGVSEGGIEAFRKDVRANMERELGQRIDARVKEQAMEALLKANEIEVPRVLVEQEADALKKRAEAQMNAGAPGQSDRELDREIFMDEAKRRVALGLIMTEVVKEGEIEVDADQVREKVEQIAADYESPEEVVKYYYGNKDQLAQVENLVLEEKVVDWVLDRVKVEEEPATFAALTGAAG